MARTAPMKLIELMVLKEDISKVIEYIGKKESFQFQTKLSQSKSSDSKVNESNIDREFFEKLSHIRATLGINPEEIKDKSSITVPCDEDRNQAAHIFNIFDEL